MTGRDAGPGPSGGLSGPFIRHPVATMMLMIGLLLVGMVSYVRLPIASLPNVSVATFLVTAQMSGADAQTNAQAVTTPLEAQFGQIAGLTQMTSASASGYAQITLQFGLGRSPNLIASDVQAAIIAAEAALPKALAQPPIYRKTNPAQTPVLIYGLTSDVLPLTSVSDYANTILAQRLSQVPGVGLVTVGGQQTPAMHLEVNPQQLAALGLTLDDIRNGAIAGTTDLSKGGLLGPEKAWAIQTNDQIRQQVDYDDMVVAYHAGAPVHLRDIGYARIGPVNPALAGWFDHQRAVILNILLAPGANVIETVDRIKAEMPRLRAALPPSINVAVVSDRTQTIRASVQDVQDTLLITIGLVVVTIFVFLRSVWATLIPGIVVPLSIVGTFAVMDVLGYSLDNLSLMGLSIAVGFVVDDAIVMIENISRYLEEGQTPLRAALLGAGEIGFTIFSISVSLVAVFIPLFMMGGVVGKMLQEFAVTVAVSIGVSVFVSLTLTPVMCALFLRPENHAPGAHGRLYNATEHAFEGLVRLYGRGLDVVLRHQGATLLSLFAAIGLTGYLYGAIPKGFFPEQDTGLIMAITQGASDISPDGLGRRQTMLTDIILKDPAVESVASYIGPGPSNAAPNQGRMFIALKPLAKRGPDGGAQQVIARLDRQVADVQGIKLFMQPAQDLAIGTRVSKSQYQFTMVDVDPQELALWSGRLVASLRHYPGITGVTGDAVAGGPQLALTIDRKAIAALGLQVKDVDQALYNAFGERIATKLYTELGQYPVIVEVAPEFRRGPEALGHIYLRTPTGAIVPLRQIATVTTRAAPLVINHQGQFPSVTVSFNLKQGVSIGTAVTAVQQTVRALHLPPTVQTAFQGNAQAYQTALAGQLPLIGVALVAVYLVLGMLYESWIHPITILSTLPSAGLGALLTLELVGMPLDVIGIIGIILLIGIVKKNGIMMVDFALQAEREGKTAHDAVREACLLRFRPILMTTLCAILGGVPLILASGIGAQLRQPLGYTIVGGLIVSQVLTLFTTPVVYLAMGRLSHRAARMRGAGAVLPEAAE
ncbi:efflux RND transporter permease subunit [Nguyenibacter vanlangensis]|uniref:Efflux RND transporter permease subunit n=1 Tax=Nguyenibacter vanlangensis TaxID=1216886 RepID=A0A7Y7IU32_9PROT|nr:efflux RND transporter permease subunit [Nguyenibacter vanlangensis]NVN10108.1 efflux RND transporter permease subunit [Nguyenibacter vanlangensis]